jgi:H+/Cl- antiporter ClcA
MHLSIKFIRWVLLITIISLISGSSSALFWAALDWISNFRSEHYYLLFLLPLAGLIIVYFYSNWGDQISKGNNLIIEEIQSPTATIPWFMAPMILISTLITHIVGGSAGREGTAVQMSSSLNDQLCKIFELNDVERKTILLASVAAGFASIFGTPLAGIFFAFEIAYLGSISYSAILPVLFASFGADYVTQQVFNIGHTSYFVLEIPTLTPINTVYSIIVAIFLGLTAKCYSILNHYTIHISKTICPNPYWRISFGSLLLMIILSVLHFVFHNNAYQGLGIQSIIQAFVLPAAPYDFIFKLILTILTLSIGFKGGEVTPLFFIGATLGSTLSTIIPLPIALLTAMGFVGVFSGCARTPFACVVMGIELFGTTPIPYITIACFIAYYLAKNNGIYSAQKGNYLNYNNN